MRAFLPTPVSRSFEPVLFPETSKWLILSDIHLPYHDVPTVELAIRAARRKKNCNVLLNGDILDSHEISSFDKDPRAPRYIEERQACIEFLRYLREKLPNSRIIYKAGNHEDRLERYLMRRAPALFGLESVKFENIMELDNFGVEYVGDKRVIRLGPLNVLHGHEYKNTIQTPVNPARGLFLRSKTIAMGGHFHQTSEHHEPTLEGKPKGCWSTGCACQLNPPYCPLNKWNHGFAFVDVCNENMFSVDNLRVLDGKVV